MNKMHTGEIIFHIAVPAAIFSITIAIGYCMVVIAAEVLKMT